MGHAHLRGAGQLHDLAHFGPAVVPAGHYFLLGDSRDRSRDSRVPDVGFVPPERIVAFAGTIFYSSAPETGQVRWDRIGRVIR